MVVRYLKASAHGTPAKASSDVATFAAAAASASRSTGMAVDGANRVKDAVNIFGTCLQRNFDAVDDLHDARSVKYLSFRVMG